MAPSSIPTRAVILAAVFVVALVVAIVMVAVQTTRRRKQRGFPIEPSDSELQTK
jgi:hypothetical protein